METMKAMALIAPRTIVPTDWVKPAVTPGHVLIKNKATGICGSDLHVYTREDGKVPYPYLVGHESAGEVVEVGEGVSSLKPGDLVTMEPGVTCGRCEFCRTGRYNLCPDVKFFASLPVQGTLCEYVVHPADMCFKLPEGMSALEGALIEPLAVGMHSVNLAEAKPGRSALILGAGCIGLCTLLSLQCYGVQDIYITDLLDLRLQKAAELGGKTINAAQTDVAETIRQATNGRLIDMVIDCTGAPDATQSIPYLIARGGNIVLTGMYEAGAGCFAWDLGAMLRKEVTIRTVFRYRNLYPASIAAVKAGLPIASIVSKVFPFERADEAFAFNVDNKAEVVKAAIVY